MIPHVGTPLVRQPLQGLRQIIRFNWTFYVLATTVVILAVPLIHGLPLGALTRGLLFSAVALASLWTAGSLVASWLVYDRSPLMNGRWINKALGDRPRTWINIHAGFDETTALLKEAFVGTYGRVFDIFDPSSMAEPSIARARRLGKRAAETECVDFRRLPADTHSIDAALLLLSAHELRTDAARHALFSEICRVLSPNGRVVVAEHLRDRANFIAFGPGFLHFHSRRTWTRCFAQSGFAVCDEFSITPFVRVFVLEKLV